MNVINDSSLEVVSDDVNPTWGNERAEIWTGKNILNDYIFLQVDVWW